MKADWIIRVELSRFYDRKKELRMRTERGATKDKILFGCFESTLLTEFTKEELKQAVKAGFLHADKIRVGGTVRNAYGWTEEECKFQPTWYKRKFFELKSYLERKGLLG